MQHRHDKMEKAYLAHAAPDAMKAHLHEASAQRHRTESN